jgi:hypothetical protein
MLGTFFDGSWGDIFLKTCAAIIAIMTVINCIIVNKTKVIELKIAQDKMLNIKPKSTTTPSDQETSKKHSKFRLIRLDTIGNLLFSLVAVIFLTGYEKTDAGFSTLILCAILIPIFLTLPSINFIYSFLKTLAEFVYSENSKNLDLMSKIIATMKSNYEKDPTIHSLPPISGFEDIGYQDTKKD